MCCGCYALLMNSPKLGIFDIDGTIGVHGVIPEALGDYLQSITG